MELEHPKSTFASKKIVLNKICKVTVSVIEFAIFLTKIAFNELTSMKKYFSSSAFDEVQIPIKLPPILILIFVYAYCQLFIIMLSFVLLISALELEEHSAVALSLPKDTTTLI